MSILDSLLSAEGGGIINQLATQFGINPEKATSVASSLVPMLASSMKEKVANNDPGITSLLTSDKMAQFADNPSSLESPAATDTGNKLVTQILGSDGASKIISTVAEKCGVGSDTVGKMLPIVATFLSSYLAKHNASGGDLTETLGQLSQQSGVMGAVKSLASKMFG